LINAPPKSSELWSRKTRVVTLSSATIQV
jgi:hypothetical protein